MINIMSLHNFIILLFVLFIPCVICKNRIELTSDQPVIMGSNITFFLKLASPDRDNFDVSWIETSRPYRNFGEVLDKSNGFSSNWTLFYTGDVHDSHYKNPGTYSISATVTYTVFLININVGTAISYFNLTRDFTGRLEPHQGVDWKNASLVSTLNETTLLVNLHDPKNFLGGANSTTWSWYNATSFIGNTTTPTLKQNITKEGSYKYNVTLTAIYPNTVNPNETVTRRGVFKTTVIAKVPITNFTVGGELWFPQGRLLNIRVLCDGSYPYTYCIQLHSGPYNLTGNESCVSPEVTNACEIPYVWYFSDPGLNSLVIIIENDLSRIVNRTLVNVYKVSKQQPLSIIIVPLSCTLIALVMIIFGIAYFWENRARYSVEVADFDFGQHDELPYMTFMERLKDALSASTSVSSRQRLYNSADDEPIINSRRGSHFRNNDS